MSASPVSSRANAAGNETELERSFDVLATRIIESRDRLRGAKALDERLFGEDFGA